MKRAVPWHALLAEIAPYYLAGERGRPRYAQNSMLRVHLTQNWFGLSDPAIPDA